MTMATISPSGREVSPVGSSCRSSRLVLLKFRLVAAANPPKSLPLIFFPDQNPSCSKRGGPVGQQGAHKPPRRDQGGRLRLAGLWPPAGAPVALLRPSIFYKSQKKSMLIFTAFGVAQNRYLKLAPFSGQNSSCWHSPSSCKPCKIREKRHKYCTVKCNNSPKSDKYQHENMMQNGRINSPKLRPRLSSSESRAQ